MEKITLNQVLSSKDLNNFYFKLRDTGYLRKWRFGITIDDKAYQEFNTLEDYYKFILVNQDDYKCTKVNNESIEESGRTNDWSGIGLFSTDKKGSPAYYQRYTNGIKDKWNPTTYIAGTNTKDYKDL